MEELLNKKSETASHSPDKHMSMNSSTHATITEYLEKLLFPTLSLSINKVNYKLN